MKIEIHNEKFNGNEYFEFTLHDGPGDSETVHGYSTDLITAFTKVIEWRERILRDYQELPVESSGYDESDGGSPRENLTLKSETD